VVTRVLRRALFPLAHAAEAPAEDPFGSFMWGFRAAELLGPDAQVSFDPAVTVLAPAFAEDPFQVPVTLDARAVAGVERIVVFVDYGPIPRILTFHPGAAEPRLSLRFKIDQATPVRAAALGADGVWHVGSAWVDAAGGGCSAPAVAYATDDWEDRLGTVRGGIWRNAGRVRAVVDHPMDTGLAGGIPVFIVQELALESVDGAPLTRIGLDEPVSEDPAFTLHFPPGALPPAVHLRGRDTSGTPIRAVLKDVAPADNPEVPR
jgi:sulfur-oxidizing protein SoxY